MIGTNHIHANLDFVKNPDVDECNSGTAKCDQDCVNIEGSFLCNCSKGFFLSEDKLTCHGKETRQHLFFTKNPVLLP